MNELLLFASTFVIVFGTGLQSLNVVHGLRLAAFITSYVIGAGTLLMLNLAPNANWTEVAAFLSGGPFGMVASMDAHPWLVARFRRREKARKVNP